ncbi:MAG: T9SS type A sorting domain-containing protein [Bacteroidetes bacterium]|nr:T9SS type A sorting domain-containing protein [Bacteroidota bacterium]
MKKFYLISVLLFGLINVYSQTPITLTFQAKDSLTQNALDLDSVNVKNLTENCDTTLYDAVSVLNIVALWPVGIENPAVGGSESFVVMQNVPNPFQGSTLVRIWLRNAGELNLAVYDNQGNSLSQYHRGFDKGWHLFGISTKESGLLLLKVSDNALTKTIKILSTGNGNEGNRITCKGPIAQGSTLKSSPDVTGFIYYLGNQLQYTAYVGGYQARILFDNPVSSETYTFAMLSSFTCGTSFTISHVAGEVAPVNKTVIYGTVTNIPGETSKCWITSNLGADHQATALSDATEASGGWYWQFNRKQGYKHTGSVRTPNTTWIYPIEEDLDWQAANDPCAIELGSGWRLPTYIEWYNVDAGGNWTNWNGPWNSALKMHAAGKLEASDGSLYSRGSRGYYWSSTQGWSGGYDLSFGSTSSSIQSAVKANAKPLRCLREPNTAALPTVTTAGITGITPTSANGGGEVTNDGGASITARGVCWSTSPNPTTADSFTYDDWGTGAFVSNLTDLIPGTPYYVRSYATNFIGTAYGNEVTFTTLPFSFTCGTSITINHVAGAVAPVNKTVTYGTVTNIPGAPSKCWITSNLGADHQATSKSDASEPSAGWYWQFNRKQGYKHTGSVRTPNTTWITSINENLSWQASNDPCALELGSGWRIPTNTEWTNVDAAGNWTDWNGPWNSALKMHAAGGLYYSSGALVSRGTWGGYWSSTSDLATHGYYLLFDNIESLTYGYYKEYGYSLRCLAYASASTIPIVSTSPVIDIAQTTATGGGNVTSDGGASVTARGVCWSTSQNPTIGDSHTTNGSATGIFVSNLTGLSPNTPYYIRAYATNSVGTAYGNEMTFYNAAGSFYLRFIPHHQPSGRSGSPGE